MNIIDVFISKLRKIDKNEHIKVNEVICKEELITYISNISCNDKYAIVLDKDGAYKDEILKRNGIYSEIQRVGASLIDAKYIEKPEDEDINLEDYLLIGIGFKNNFASNSIRLQSMGLGLSLIDFFLEDSKKQNVQKFLFIENEEVLEHWGLKTNLKILKERNFNVILLGD